MELFGLDAGYKRMREIKDDFLVYKLISGLNHCGDIWLYFIDGGRYAWEGKRKAHIGHIKFCHK